MWRFKHHSLHILLFHTLCHDTTFQMYPFVILLPYFWISFSFIFSVSSFIFYYFNPIGFLNLFGTFLVRPVLLGVLSSFSGVFWSGTMKSPTNSMLLFDSSWPLRPILRSYNKESFNNLGQTNKSHGTFVVCSTCTY